MGDAPFERYQTECFGYAAPVDGHTLDEPIAFVGSKPPALKGTRAPATDTTRPATRPGRKIRVPDSGKEQHWSVARMRKIGNVQTEKVMASFSISEGAGDLGNFKVRVLVPLDQVPHRDVELGFKEYTFIMVKIAESKVPHDSSGSALDRR